MAPPSLHPLFLSLCEWLTLPIVHFHRPPFLLIKIWKNQFFVSLCNYNRPNFIINFRNRFPFSLQMSNKLYYYFCTVLKFTPLIHTSLFHTVSTSHINFTRFTDLSLSNFFYISCSPLNAWECLQDRHVMETIDISYNKSLAKGNARVVNQMHKWDNAFKNGPTKIHERQHLKNLKWHGMFKIF